MLLVFGHFFDMFKLSKFLFIVIDSVIIRFVLIQYSFDKLIVRFDMVKELRFDVVFCLLHDVFVAQFELYFFDALHVGVGDFAMLVALAFFNDVRPLEAVEVKVELNDVNWMHEVDESKANTTLSLEVFWQIKVVILVCELLVYQI